MNYHIITIGCQMNKADSERIANYLELNQYRPQANYPGADLVIINTCGVRQSAEDRVYGLVNQIKKSQTNSYLIITGCLSHRLDVKKRLKDKVDLFMPITQLAKLKELMDNKNLKTDLNKDPISKEGDYLKIKAKYQSAFSAYIPIGNGCNNFCSYCVVPYARGQEVYRPAEDIIKEIKILLKKGYKEIILIAQNVNSYQAKNYNFPKLLSTIANLEGDFWLRFTSSHPKDLSDKLIKVIGQHHKIANHLHLALQSGDDQILRAMNRQYQVADFISIVKKLRQVKPQIAISTDIIVAFPGESQAQFKNTLKVFKLLKFDMAYIAQYSPRPPTAAWSLKDKIKKEEKKNRAKALTEILKKSALENNRKYLNKDCRVLLDSINRQGKLQGKTSSFKTVIIKNHKAEPAMLGQFVKVKISQAREFNLIGEII